MSRPTVGVYLAAVNIEIEWECALVWRLYGARFARGLQKPLQLVGWGEA